MRKIVIFLLLAIMVLAGVSSCASTSHTSQSPKNGQHSGGCH